MVLYWRASLFCDFEKDERTGAGCPTTLQAIRKVAGASCCRFSECVFSQIFVRTSIFQLNSAYRPAGCATTISFAC
jgi:hypothetical protein